MNEILLDLQFGSLCNTLISLACSQTSSWTECVHDIVMTIHGMTQPYCINYNLTVFTELKPINACLPVVKGVASWLNE